ncbi:MAG: NADH-quinone oxidoreductase subunit G [Actinomycetes bacterium]
MSENGAPDTVTLTIDGQEVTVPKGTLIIRAAEQLGNIIPRFCDHPLLDPVGACRQCVVEVEGVPKPLMACTSTCTPDMVVRTHLTSEVARRGQAGTMEFLLINHPLDCPMCDKGGECPLQDQALAHGNNTSRFVDEKRRYTKPVAVSSQVLLDRERCVLCARCTRFSEQISGDPFIELFERGALEQVAIYEDEPYESYFSGNVIQICPVGALTSADYRFKARPFDVRSAPSVCDHCSAGCTLTIQSRRGEIQRQLARTNMPVNEMWNCDKGRFGFHLLTSDVRVTEPLRRAGGQLVPTSWSEALVTTATVVRESLEAGEGRVAVLTGGRVADEDAYAVAKFARTVLRTDHVDFRTRTAPAGEGDALTALAGRDGATYADVEAAPVIVVVGLDPEEEVPILHLRIRKAWRNSTAKVVPVGARMGSLAEYAWRRLATQPGAEADALAALGRALGMSSMAEAAAGSGFTSPALDDVVEAVRAAGSRAVVLVGERAGAGALATAGAIADHLGARVAWVPRRAGARGALEAGLAAGLLPGGRRLADDADRAEVEGLWGTLPAEAGSDLQGILEAAAAGRIDVLHLVGVDPLRDAPSRELVEKALAKVKLVVAQDLALTETVAAHADVVLPVTATQERAGSYTDWEGRTQRFQPAVAGPDLTMDDWEVVQQLAAVLGHDLGFNDLDGLRAEAAKLATRATAHAWPAPAAAELPEAGERLRLVTHAQLLDRGTMLTGSTALLATARAPFVAVHPDDAERLGVEDGAEVTVTGAGGSVRLPARVEADVVAGSVFVPANSTETPVSALVGADGVALVELTVAAPAEVPA